MLLKSLELNGFKSFAGKTVLDFHGGITAIVGPNGSGKSNIIDCIRWLLGEREAKNLRGERAEDLIWSGTAKRPRVSLASASLHFNNGSGFLPVEFSEVSINRKVTRDGVSRYFLNKAEIRLKDIIDFFSKSRLGSRGLTVIGQGSSDVFVRSSPEERLAMIEEILGLREYQIKKGESERKLRATLINLEKVKAMIQEVLPRLRLLKRQTAKWSRRLDIKNELSELEDNYFSFKLGQVRLKEDEVQKQLDSVEKNLALREKKMKFLEEEVKKIESQASEYRELKKIKEKRNEILNKRSNIEKELARLEARAEFANLSGARDEKDYSDLSKLLSEVKLNLEENLNISELSKLKSAIKMLIDKIEDFLGEEAKTADSHVELKEARARLTAELSSLEKVLKNLEMEEIKITSELETFNKGLKQNLESLEKERQELRELETEKNKIFLEKEKSHLELNEIKNRLNQIGRDLKEFNKFNLSFSQEELSDIEKRMFRLQGELASMGEVDHALIKEAEDVEAHYSFLSQQSKDLEKAAENLKTLVKQLKEKVHYEFTSSLKLINEEFNKFFRLMFNGGAVKLKVKSEKLKVENVSSDKELGGEENNEKEASVGVDIELNLPKKKTMSLETLSGGEKSLVSIAALFALVSISPPPFLVLDEIDAALDESNSRRFAELIKEFSKKTQFVIATHNRATMEVADILYGITLGEDGASRILSLKLET